MAYTTETLVSNRLGRDLTSSESALVDTLIEAVQQYIDAYTGGHFDEVEESTRRYDGGVQNLSIDPCTSITAVAHYNSDGTLIGTLEATDYVAEPINQAVKYELRRIGAKFASGIANVRVTAKFSWYNGAVPSAITYVATELVAGIYSNKTGVTKESIEGYSVEYERSVNEDPGIKAALEAYKISPVV